MRLWDDLAFRHHSSSYKCLTVTYFNIKQKKISCFQVVFIKTELNYIRIVPFIVPLINELSHQDIYFLSTILWQQKILTKNSLQSFFPYCYTGLEKLAK